MSQKIVKISMVGDFPLLRQLPKEQDKFKNVKFVINQDIDFCDYWIVFDKLPKEDKCICPPDNVLFIAGEPPMVKNYSRDFLQQFAKVISCHSSIRHRGLLLSHPFLPWLVGVAFDKNIRGFKNDKYLSFENFYNGQFVNKTKLISIITSNKSFTKGHRKRLTFLSKLREALGDKLDIYGAGFKEIPDKLEALKDYKYSVVIENSKHAHYWTEKIADSFLCETFPIYYGCDNIGDYFPINSYSSIDIANPNSLY